MKNNNMKKNNKLHKTKEVAIKKELVDIKMIPIIKAMNAFYGITTLFSCEGDPYPYVSFFSNAVERCCGTQVILKYCIDNNIDTIINMMNVGYTARDVVDPHTVARISVYFKNLKEVNELTKILIEQNKIKNKTVKQTSKQKTKSKK